MAKAPAKPTAKPKSPMPKPMAAPKGSKAESGMYGKVAKGKKYNGIKRDTK